MLDVAIQQYQLGKIEKSQKTLAKLNRKKQHQTFLSLQLEAVCCAKLNRLSEALKLAELAAQKSTQYSQTKEIESLIVNIKKAMEQTDVTLPILAKIADKASCVTADNEYNQSLIIDLIEALECKGARFSKSLLFVEEKGNLKIEHASKGVDPVKMIIPINCMPLLSDYEFYIEDGELAFRICKSGTTNLSAQPILEKMLLLYRETNKLKDWKANYLLFVIGTNSPLLSSLTAFRPFPEKVKKYLTLASQGNNSDELLIRSFLGSREFNYKLEHTVNADFQLTTESETGLLAIIDFLNHKVGTQGYAIDKNTSAMYIASNDNSETELFVQYGVFDPLQTLLIYGFVDQQAPFIYSGLFELELPSGVLLCNLAYAGKAKRAGSLSKALEHLHQVMPAGVQKQGNKIGVTDIIIPDASERHLLLEVIEYILVTANAEHYQNKANLKADTEKVLVSIIQVNLTFWKHFQQQVTELLSPELAQKSQLLTLSQLYIDKLTQYETQTEQ